MPRALAIAVQVLFTFQHCLTSCHLARCVRNVIKFAAFRAMRSATQSWLAARWRRITLLGQNLFEISRQLPQDHTASPSPGHVASRQAAHCTVDVWPRRPVCRWQRSFARLLHASAALNSAMRRKASAAIAPGITAGRALLATQARSSSSTSAQAACVVRAHRAALMPLRGDGLGGQRIRSSS